MKDIKLNKINKSYAADPNTSEPMLKIYNRKIFLEFLLNAYLYKFNEGDKGQIIFEDCLMFRGGSPNDEGMYTDPKNPTKNNYSIWNTTDFPTIEPGSFYEVLNSDWTSITDYGGYVNNKVETINKSEFRHFVFFMKEGTFECVAKNYIEVMPL